MNLNHYRKFLRKNGYAVPGNDNDVIYRVRAIMKARFPCGWSDHYKRHGGVLLSSIEQNLTNGDKK